MSVNKNCFRGRFIPRLPKSHFEKQQSEPAAQPFQPIRKTSPEQAFMINQKLNDPSYWGKEQWIALHTHAACASDQLTDDEKTAWQNYLESFPFILACKTCCKHFDEMIENNPITDEVLKTKESLSFYIFTLHNKVNKRLGKPEKSLDFLAERFGIYIP